MQTLGRISSYLKKASTDLTTQVRRELEAEEEELKSQLKIDDATEEEKPPETETTKQEIKQPPLPDDM